MLTIKDKMGLDFEFFDAVESDDITEEIEKKYFSNTDFYEWDINQKAVMATFMSHMSLLRYSCENKTNLLIIEDDIDYIGNINFNDIKFNEFDILNVGTPSVVIHTLFHMMVRVKYLMRFILNKSHKLTIGN